MVVNDNKLFLKHAHKLISERSCIYMYSFKPVTLSDCETFNKYFNINSYYNSEYNFTTIFAWRRDFSFSHAILNDCLCIKSSNNTFHFPLGEEKNIIGAIKCLQEYTEHLGIKLKFGSLSSAMIDFLRQNNILENFHIEPIRNYFDYIYKRESFENLRGKKLHGKRNHFNFFKQHYEYTFTDITNPDECLEKLRHWICERSLEPKSEFLATSDVFENRDILGLTGKCLMVEGEIAGIILGHVHHDMVLIQIAKADTKFRGAPVALFQLFLSKNFLSCEYVNFMEDMGIEGLRKSKLSYNPAYLLEKYVLIQTKKLACFKTS